MEKAAEFSEVNQNEENVLFMNEDSKVKKAIVGDHNTVNNICKYFL